MLAQSLPSTIPPDAREASRVVSRQVARVRRRRNGFVLQRAIYEAVALAAGIAVTLVGLAFLLGETSYTLVAWGALAGWLGFVVRAVRRCRTAWLGADATIELDRTASLESRLSTLVGLVERAPPSRLWPLLVRENLEALPRWSPERITPRAVPRSLWAALVALAALVATLLALPEGASDGGFIPRPQGGAAPTEEVLPELLPGGGEPFASEGPLVDWSGFLASLPEQIRDEILRRARRAPPGTSPPEGARPVGRSANRGDAAGGGPGDAKESNGRPGESGDGDGAGERPQVPMEVAPHDRPRVDEGAAPPAPPKQGDGLKVLGANPDLPGLGASSSEGGAGAGTGTDGEGLYGDPEADGGPTAVFSLDLDAERGDGGEGEDRDDPTRPDSALAREHRVDDAVRRARVPPAYEKIVERLFQPDREAGAAR